VLRGRGEQGESSIGDDPVAFHQDALGLPDEVPVDDRGAQLPGPQRSCEVSAGAQYCSRDEPADSLELGGLSGLDQFGAESMRAAIAGSSKNV
jgi:hypothetical protein